MNTSEIYLKKQDTQKRITFKRLSFYSLSTTIVLYMILVFTFLTSCSSDDTPITEEPEVVVKPDVLPVITLESGSTEVTQGVVNAPGNIGSLQHKVKATAEEGFKHLIISKVLDGVKSEYQTIDTNHPDYVDGSNSFTYDLGYIFKKEEVGKELYFEAEIVDIKDNTKSLKFAEATIKMPMIKESFTLTTTTNGDFGAGNNYYLHIQNDAVKPLKRDDAATEENDEYVAAILSYNGNADLYIASPTDIDEIYLTDALPAISTTKFKYDKVAETNLHDDFNEFDVYKIETNYEDTLFADKDERIEDLIEGNRFYLKTEDNRIAILQVTDISINVIPTSKAITFDIYITQ